MTNGDQKYSIYPDYCHELSPTIGRWCPLRAVDVHALESLGMYDNGKEIYYYGNHPIKWVRITGVIVAIDEFSTRRVYTIDDSSGVCIECTCPAPPPQSLALPPPLNQDADGRPTTSTNQNCESASAKRLYTPSVEAPLVPWDEIDVGMVVKVKGKPNTFRAVKQVDIVKIELMRSTEQEVRCWNEVLAFRKEVLRVPWVVSQEAENRFRRRAEREKQYKHSSKKHRSSKAEKVAEVSRDKGKDRIVERQRGNAASHDKGEKDTNKRQKRKHEIEEGLKPENRANYPSLAMRRQLAGKYDALGI
ncbi:hypothetical protein OIDMADRAFT_142682 [Oidiodendron maius Zn]|uniref:CST complex subunit STN1 n=1 Tax=Oidiodendron maius (strain Zn) TaxID=913774 RepID=A0A0C3HPC8_OIDMZ|nr:hypothetical protein OIDMADRAFT_142682 [Oidiodendron maius Zn]